MRSLYIFPHPDDESFGPGTLMHKHRRQDHEVHLLTLTKGEATKQRFRLNYTKQQMAEVRHKELQNAAEVLNLSSLTVLDMPDNNLKDTDPRKIEGPIREHILKIRPDVVVTYDVNGVSGFADHVTTHAIVKRVYLELRDREDFLKRLAFFDIAQEVAEEKSKIGPFHLTGAKPEEVDCICPVDPVDIQAANRALDCYPTFTEVIDKTHVRETIEHDVLFVFFQEHYDPYLGDLFEGLA